MNNISFMLMADTYKNTNPDAMPKGLTKLTSYITPRKSMFKELDEVAYVRFASVYREFKDVNTFMAEIKKILEK